MKRVITVLLGPMMVAGMANVDPAGFWHFDGDLSAAGGATRAGTAGVSEHGITWR